MREKSEESREEEEREKRERGGRGRAREKFLPFHSVALRDILVVSSRRVSALISEILNAPIPMR